MKARYGNEISKRSEKGEILNRAVKKGFNEKLKLEQKLQKASLGLG